jgi:hypothetical protein
MVDYEQLEATIDGSSKTGLSETTSTTKLCFGSM